MNNSLLTYLNTQRSVDYTECDAEMLRRTNTVQALLQSVICLILDKSDEKYSS